jgi:SAM-dependent methyltransferase
VSGPDVTARASTDRVFDAALVGEPLVLVGEGGERLPATPGRWFGGATGEDDWLLARCTGPTVDLGCGPGRLVSALSARGVPALGVDRSVLAVRECRARGGPAVRGDLFAPLPGEGGWGHVLLADGNVGIGGDPEALLSRCSWLVRPGGSLLAPVSDWFAWAVLTLPALLALAHHLGLIVAEAHQGARGFARLLVPAV